MDSRAMTKREWKLASQAARIRQGLNMARYGSLDWIILRNAEEDLPPVDEAAVEAAREVYGDLNRHERYKELPFVYHYRQAIRRKHPEAMVFAPLRTVALP